MYVAKDTQHGFSLIEMLIYISILSVTAVFVVTSLLQLLDNYTHLQVSRAVSHSGSTALERIVREIRQADSVDTAASTLGTHPGVLVLETPATTTEMYLNGDRVYVKENGSILGPLTSADVSVTNMTFRRATNGRTSGVQVVLEVQARSDDIEKQATFQGGAVLRGRY